MRVIAAPAAEPVSLSTARMHCRVDSLAEEALMSIYITAAREWIEHYVGHLVAGSTVEVNSDTFPLGDITLAAGPVASIVKIGYYNTLGVEVAVSSSAYWLDSRGDQAYVRLQTGQTWPTVVSTANAAFVRYIAGYTVVPSAIVAATLMLVSHMYLNREATTTETLQTVPMGVINLLDIYRTRLGMA